MVYPYNGQEKVLTGIFFGVVVVAVVVTNGTLALNVFFGLDSS